MISVVASTSPVLESSKCKKKKLCNSSQDACDAVQIVTDPESDSDDVAPRKTRSKAKESPQSEKKAGKDKRQSVGKKEKNSEEESLKDTSLESVDKKTNDNQTENIDSDEMNCKTENRVKGDRPKSSKGGKMGKAKNKIGKSVSKNSENLSPWAEKRPTPSMDYNESNAKCPLPGCDSKGNA